MAMAIAKAMTETLPWSNVRGWLAANPTSTHGLAPYIPAIQTVTGTRDTTDADGFIRVPVTPCTPLSAVLMAQDVVFSASTDAARRAALRDETTDLQEKAVLLLKGRQWPIRRTAEGIASAGMEEGRLVWPELGWEAVAALRECQIVVVDEDKKTVCFVPEDVRTWSLDIETFVVSHDCRALWTKPVGKTLALGHWIGQKDGAGWTIAYPLVDGTMEELKSLAAKSLETLPVKTTKDVLRRRIGRSQAIDHLQHFV
jgi:hypothetical protein